MQEDHKIQEPNIEGMEMKMPENADLLTAENTNKRNVISGPLLLILALLLILILAGMYYWFGTLSTAPTTIPPESTRPTAEQNNEPESTTAEAETDMMRVTSPSDELDAIEADIAATNLDTLDIELQTIDTEIEAALQ